MTFTTLTKQHVIDSEVCIRCNTCAATCLVCAIQNHGGKGSSRWAT